ncbi:nucleotidyl transferase AbiEii/AbiGii toxin family protein [Microbacterium sp. LWS13-1.2]|uniref:Nucleotidyl transferase AbiEii/AbiGii toxin family protein n=1 Tax=Microbacterium sp. LWS13-1.2 TaxID=3135264 RepID=A0AAU6SGS7_9MICO
MREAGRGRHDGRVAGVLDDRERELIEATFRVDPEQVVRDHVISHALAAIASAGADDVIFFGGTALSRTHLTELRLSEDIDLIALGDRRAIADRIESAVARRLQRSLGAVAFTPPLRDTRHPEPSVMQVGDTRIQIQLLASDGYPAWPTEVVDIEQRYSDAAPAKLRVLTAAAFVASKLSSWSDRQASRDLYDLWAMSERGLIDAEAVDLFGRLGSYTSAASVPFTNIPSDAEWNAALSHQGMIRIGPGDAAKAVRVAIEAALER